MVRARFRSAAGARCAAVAAAALLLGGCEERDRLTFPNTGDGRGPVSFIDQPSQDTTIGAGPTFLVAGRVIDGDRVDSVFFEILGGASAFPPLDADEDTVRFSLILPTGGLAGRQVTVRVFGVDVAGNVGAPASRTLDIR